MQGLYSPAKPGKKLRPMSPGHTMSSGALPGLGKEAMRSSLEHIEREIGALKMRTAGSVTSLIGSSPAANAILMSTLAKDKQILLERTER